MLIGWPGRQPLEDWQLLVLLLALGAVVTAIVFRYALRRARRDQNSDLE